VLGGHRRTKVYGPLCKGVPIPTLIVYISIGNVT
jgi:hypothetical protein